MKTVEEQAIALGRPSYVWRFGQERRLDLIRRYVKLENKRILDIGCGIGTYVSQLRRFSDDVYGVDVDLDRIREGSRSVPNLYIARGEDLPFQNESFDLVLLHEVLEHVEDDQQTVREAYRATKLGGNIVIYAPNRLYPFETHGFYWGKRYIFKLVPFVNYLPNRCRRIFVPHARTYLAQDIQRLFQGLPIGIVVHTYVYPGFDGIASRRPRLASFLRCIFYWLERTPLRVFGLSHLLVVRKDGGQT